MWVQSAPATTRVAMARILDIEDNKDNVYMLTPRPRRNVNETIDSPRLLGRISALLPTETAT